MCTKTTIFWQIFFIKMEKKSQNEVHFWSGGGYVRRPTTFINLLISDEALEIPRCVLLTKLCNMSINNWTLNKYSTNTDCKLIIAQYQQHPDGHPHAVTESLARDWKRRVGVQVGSLLMEWIQSADFYRTIKERLGFGFRIVEITCTPIFISFAQLEQIFNWNFLPPSNNNNKSDFKLTLRVSKNKASLFRIFHLSFNKQLLKEILIISPKNVLWFSIFDTILFQKEQPEQGYKYTNRYVLKWKFQNHLIY